MPTQNFETTLTLPHVNCAEEDVYQLCRTLKPNANLVDGTSLKVDPSTGQISAGASTAYFHKYTKTFTNFSAAALNFDVELFQLPAGGVIHAIKLKHSALFGGGTISSYTLSIGIGSNLTKYMAAKNVNGAVTSTNYHMVWAPFFNYMNITLPVGAAYNQTELTNFRNAYQALFSGIIGTEDHLAPQSIRITAVAVGGNLSTATQGSVDVWVLYSILS